MANHRRSISMFAAFLSMVMLVTGLWQAPVIAEGDIGAAAENASFGQGTYNIPSGGTGVVSATFSV